ncbi:MAG: 4Fe-4S dicluster domain-containing protein [Candidatus Marsarchaeota archaeon]|nr:4Fe-4S dicluster domain-containing protein [Candidatus Marsarchaeota archaeon]
MRVCPTGASSQRKDGIVTVDADKCIGCKSCMIACPYGARYILEEKRTYFRGYMTPYEEQGYSNFQVGTVSKCDFCAHRIDEGLAQGLVPGVDREATPACVINCWANARTFGDLNDPNSEVYKLVNSGQVVQLKPETGLDPRVYYLAPGRTAIALSGGLPNRSSAHSAVKTGASREGEVPPEALGFSAVREDATLP